MKKLLIALLAATGLSTPACAEQAAANAEVAAQATNQAPAARPAAARPDADPAMWVVRDEDTTIYLFGTFHLMDGKADWFNDEVKEAFDRSQELVFEIDMPDDPAQLAAQMQPLVMRYAIDSSGKKLSQRLTAEENKALSDAVSSIGVPAAALDMFEPWFASMTLTQVIAQRLGMTPESGAEAVLKQAARGRNMRFGAVETIEGQLQMFDTMPEAMQIAQLKETLKGLNEAQQMMPRMIAVWNSGDAEGMDRLLNEGLGDNPQLRRTLLGARNEKWAEWIDGRLDQPGTVFMAVGAGHLVGNDSVQSFLQRRSIRSQRVPNKTPNR